MDFRSLLFGVRPSVKAWAAVLALVFVAGLSTYALLATAPRLPRTAAGLALLAGEVLVRVLLLAQLARLVLIVGRDKSSTPMTLFWAVASVLGCAWSVGTLPLNPGSWSLLSIGLSAAGLWVGHRFINRQLAEIDALGWHYPTNRRIKIKN